MSLDDFLVEKKPIDNSIKSCLIHLIGGHCSGKSGLAGRLKEKYENKIKVLGKYSKSPTSNGLLTGGMDGVQMKNSERFDLIRKNFIGNDKIIVCEGFMIIYYSSFLVKYYDLQKERNRDVYIIHLATDMEVIYKRIFKRSKGKELSKKRKDHLISISNSARSGFEKLNKNKNFFKIEFNNSNDNFDDIFKELCKIVEKYL